MLRLAAWQLGRNDPRRRLRTAFKFWSSILTCWRSTEQWLRCLDEPGLRPLMRVQPRLIDKPHHPYINDHWSSARRVNALISHYRWMTRRLSSNAIASIYARRPLKLCDFKLPDATREASLWLGCAHHQTREGELALSLCVREKGAILLSSAMPPVLATLVFSVVEEEGVHHFTIGCVQGAADADLNDFKVLTKAMHGLRPKALLVRAAQFCADAWQLPVRGIAPAAHPFTNWRYRLSRVKRAAVHHMSESYGALWLESGGIPGAGGWMTLPSAPAIKSREQVTVSKRALYERRGRLLCDMGLQIDAALKSIEGRKR